jgi:hypothetical protein
MVGEINYNLAAVLVSLAALLVSLMTLTLSTVLTVRQLRIANKQLRTTESSSQDNHVTTTILKLNAEYRSNTFQRSEDFVLHRLGRKHDSGLGISGLPLKARQHVVRVGHLYGDYGTVAALPTCDESRIVAQVHYRVREAWAVLEPYINTERRIHRNIYFSHFEHLASLATEVDKAKVLEAHGLRRIKSPQMRLAEGLMGATRSMLPPHRRPRTVPESDLS